jgi:predicted secreted hydrolase
MRRRRFLATPLLLPTLLVEPRFAAAESSIVYPAVTPGYRVHLPRDHGAHADFRIEWWYVTGALDAPTADIGFQLTFFRFRPGYAEKLRSPLAARQILLAHTALSWPGDRLQYSERSARAHLGAHFSTSDCDVAIGAWHLWRATQGEQEFFRLQAQSSAFTFDFTLTPTQAPLLQGVAGYSRKGGAPEQASYYLSWPQLRVGGTLRHAGRSQAVAGHAWFDHEWSSTLLTEQAVGWDWLGVNLADGGALMAFRLRDAHGVTLFADATWRDASGRQRRFAAGEIGFTPLRHWRSPHSGGDYPVEIEIRLGERRVRTRPVLDDQELNTRRPSPVVYWEGLVHLDGDWQGRGYLELTGYTQRLRI